MKITRIVQGLWGLAALAVVFASPPALAQSTLVHGGVAGDLSPGDETMGDGSYRDCHVLRVQPGDQVILQHRSNAFDAYLVVVLGDACGAQSTLYANDDLDGDRTDAGLHFRATAPTYSVAATSFAAGETGPYLLSTRIIPAAAVREDVQVRDADGVVLPPSRSQPERLINNLYAADDPFSPDDPASLQTWFTPFLVEGLMVLDQATDGMGLGFDFLVDGQDSDLSNFALSLRPGEDPDAPVVRARFMNFDTPVTLDFVMAQSQNSWRISDIRSIGSSGRPKWTLIGLLEDAIFEIRNGP